MADGLFPDEDPLDKYVKIGNYKFRVIGVLKKMGKWVFKFRPSPPHSMSAPKSPVQSRCKPKVLIEIMLQISYNLRSKAGKAVRKFENCKKKKSVSNGNEIKKCMPLKKDG